jgi:NAD(P)-dependent dehydrogenase (short-subunit alcohol dehydrogenase family)
MSHSQKLYSIESDTNQLHLQAEGIQLPDSFHILLQENVMFENVLITGSSRGIGLGLVKVFLSQGDHVFAACRNPQDSKELQTLKKSYPDSLELIQLKVDSDSSVLTAANVVAAKTDHLDILLNNAGISPGQPMAKLEDVDFKDCRDAYETNALGPMRVARTFLPLLHKSKKPRVVNTTSGLASLSGKNSGGYYAYGASKAALNMITRTMAFEWKEDGIIVVCLDPGWVKTDMGGPNAMLTIEESTSAITRTVKGLTLEKTSQFIYNDGKSINW